MSEPGDRCHGPGLRTTPQEGADMPDLTPPPSLAGMVRVDPNGCWLWTQALNNEGYGRHRAPCSCGEAVRMVQAHRFVYEMLVGPITDGLHLDHLCRVRHCVNPDHVEPVTTRTNTLRGVGPTAVNAAKTHCKRGHEFTPENTYLRTDGHRRCRTCNRQDQHAYQARRRSRLLG